LILPAIYHDSLSIIIANNPFYSLSSAKIHSVKNPTSNGNVFWI